MSDRLKIRVHGDSSLNTLVYLPGMHGDWMLSGGFRAAISGKARFVEFTYPRTTTWSLDDFAEAIEEALVGQGIDRGWLLGESFGSQPAWAILRRAQEHSAAAPLHGSATNHPRLAPVTPNGFRPLGLILAGGFVRHPLNWGVGLMGWISRKVPLWFVRSVFGAYSLYARFRFQRAPETLARIAEFAANRTNQADRRAITHRYRLITKADFRPVARAAAVPVFYLAGSFDPLVPWCYVRWWLRRNCPTYHGGKTIWLAEHNVLGSAPRKSAHQIFSWMSAAHVSQTETECSERAFTTV
jgi:pimeloyl-ACP methyl ester carboxylesterase